MTKQNEFRDYTIELIRRVSGNDFIDLSIEELETMKREATDNPKLYSKKTKMWINEIIKFKSSEKLLT